MDGLSGAYLSIQLSAMPRRDRKALLYSLCAELAGCNIAPTHIAALLHSNVKYVIDVLCELGLHRRRRDHSADEAYDRLPADIRGRVNAFREHRADGKC